MSVFLEQIERNVAEWKAKRAQMGRAVEEWKGKTPDAMPPERVRERIRETWGDRCYLSGIEFRGKPFDVEHVVRVKDGGIDANREGNMRPVLRDPHIIKTAREKKEQAKADRKKRAAAGTKARKSPPIKSAPFPAPEKKTPATGKIEKLASLPPRQLYRDA